MSPWGYAGKEAWREGTGAILCAALTPGWHMVDAQQIFEEEKKVLISLNLLRICDGDIITAQFCLLARLQTPSVMESFLFLEPL